MTDEIKKHRDQIDLLDEQIIKILNQRASHASAIGKIKQGARYRPEREAQILRRIKQLNTGPLAAETLIHVYREIMSACFSMEQATRVAYLGPSGTFSEAAAIQHFGHVAAFDACASVDEALHKVEAESADYAIVPVENSSEGTVGRTLDLLVQTPLKICAEALLRVHQHILSKAGSLKSIKKIYSHPQAFAQCDRWLNQNLAKARRIPMASTAEAAHLASQEINAGAIAGELAAVRYGLKIAAKSIEDEPNNTTRFWVIGKHDAQPSGEDKTTLVLSAKNQPGALYDLLTPLAKNKINMTKLESRPAHAGIWEYMFFVDIEGHRQDKQIAEVLEQLTKNAAYINVLGSYPMAVI